MSDRSYRSRKGTAPTCKQIVHYTEGKTQRTDRDLPVMVQISDRARIETEPRFKQVIH